MSAQRELHTYIVSPARIELRKDPQRLKIAEAFRKYFRTSGYVPSVAGNRNTGYLLLRPTPDMREAFGLEREVLCFISDYHELEVRTLEAASGIIESSRLRLEQDVFFLVSDAPNAQSLSERYTEEHGRRIVVASWRDIESAHEDYPRELLRAFFYSRDLFNQTTAVSRDGQFFARSQIVEEVLDNLRHGQNCGIFGLRKIGKTSVLQRVQQKNTLARSFTVAYIDAQLPEINTTDAATVAVEILRKFNGAWASEHGEPLVKNPPAPSNIADASKMLSDFMSRLIAQSNKRAVLIIDELERILPSTVRHTSWRSEYLQLWRLLRSIHSTLGEKFVFLVASTNPFFAETPDFEDEDNPLYRFFKTYYLTFFSMEELDYMLCRLGKPMGIEFSPEAMSAIYIEYGGHPFLSRQLCSNIAKHEQDRPLTILPKHVASATKRATGQVQADISAILKIFSDFYPHEFDALQNFAKDKTTGRRDFEKQPLLVDHLIGYGLIKRVAAGTFEFAMKALDSYFEGTTLPRVKAPSVPLEITKRHLEIQARVNEIEPALRALVMTKMREEFGASWQVEIGSHLSAADNARIEEKGRLGASAFMEELFFPQLLEIISGRYSAFAKTFGSKQTFKEQISGASTARVLSDHRKLTDCGNDALYLKALRATEFFYDALMLR